MGRVKHGPIINGPIWSWTIHNTCSLRLAVRFFHNNHRLSYSASRGCSSPTEDFVLYSYEDHLLFFVMNRSKTLTVAWLAGENKVQYLQVEQIYVCPFSKKYMKLNSLCLTSYKTYPGNPTPYKNIGSEITRIFPLFSH